MTAPTETTTTKPRWRWLAFAAVLAATMMDLLDATIAGVAGPVIQTDLGGSYADLQWIAAAYTLAMAVGLLTGGRLGDMFGRKPMLLVGVTGFTLASVACAAAPSAEILIASRAAQGLLGALMLPQVFGLIRDLFKPDEMGKAWAILGPVSGLSAVLGPVVAGLLIDADLFGSGWRSIFLINVPIAAFVVIAGGRHLPSPAPSARERRLDLPGMALAAAGTSMLVVPLVQGRELGWPTWTLVMLAAAVPVLVGFAALQLRRKRAGATTLVEPSVFGKRAYVSGIAFALVFLAAMGGIMLSIGVYMQAGLGYSPIEAALTTAPYAIGGFFGSGVGGALMHKLGRTILQAGLVVKGAGLVLLYAVLHQAGTDVGNWDFVVPLFVAGVGMGMVFVPLFDIILAGVEDHEVGSAAGVLQAMQQLGMALGVAAVGTLFFGLAGEAPDLSSFASAAEATALVSATLIVVAFAIAFLLPAKAREEQPVPAGVEPAFA